LQQSVDEMLGELTGCLCDLFGRYSRRMLPEFRSRKSNILIASCCVLG
jgi:hypothetical protein